MVRGNIRLLGGALVTGGLGYWAGANHKKLELGETLTHVTNMPGLPRGASVSVSRGLSVQASTAIAPSSAPSGLVIPPSDTGVPPEPHKEAPRVSQIMRFGFPGLDNIRAQSDYILSYDRRNRVAHWVFEHLTLEGTRRAESVDRQKSAFEEDKSLHPYFRSANSDYKYSGFDRGHMAAAGNHMTDQRFMDDTFLLSNMAPQVGKGFNRDKWEHLERYVRKLVKVYKNVYCCTGPLYLPRMEADGKNYVKYQVIGANNVAVPTHFFKIVVMENESRDLELDAFVLPNQEIPDSTPLDNFRVPPESVERAAGLLFFDKINRDKLVKINGVKTSTGWF